MTRNGQQRLRVLRLLVQKGRLCGRPLKAAERKLSQSGQVARALRWHVKQEQVSRKCARTAKHEHCLFVREPEQNIEEFEHDLASVEDFHENLEDGAHAHVEQLHFTINDSFHKDHRDILRDIDYKLLGKQGWKMIAMYRDREDGRQGGRFLAFNILRQEVCLARYDAYWGYWYPDVGPLYPESGDIYSYGADIINTLDRSRPRRELSRREAFFAPAEEFLLAAQRLAYPVMSLMRLHRVQPEDPQYHSLVALYKTYTLFHSRVGRTLSLQGWPSRETVRAVAAWRPREWTRRRIEALVRVQALWRGWYLRQRVLYSPHTELGRRLLLRTWHRDLEHYVPS